MPGTLDGNMEHVHTPNCALLYEEVLLDICLVTDGGMPAGPAFLYSLASLIEAAIIHEITFVDARSFEAPSGVWAMVRDSELVQGLMRNGILRPLPAPEAIDADLESRGIDYSYWDFVSDAVFELRTFSVANPREELSRYRELASVLRTTPQVFTDDDLIDPSIDEDSLTDPTLIVVKNAHALRLLSMGFTVRDLLIMGGFNHRAYGFSQLANHLQLQLCPAFTAIPHYIGAVTVTNNKTRSLYEKVVDKATEFDEQLRGGARFSRIPIPPLCQIVLSGCKGSGRALLDEILELRHRQMQFRGYITQFERDWGGARTRDDERRLLNEFDLALAAQVASHDRPTTRLVYVLWDILKNPLTALQAAGDKLASKGRELRVINRVSGLHDFWAELVSSPLPRKNLELLSATFDVEPDDAVWNAAAELAESTNNVLVGREGPLIGG
jgi:hypothetical protein